MKKIKILVTASTFPLFKNDSTPRFILDICRSIKEIAKFECLVLVPHAKGSKVREKIEDIEIKRYIYMYPYSLEKISGSGIMSKIKKNRLLFLLVPFFLFSQLLFTILTIKNYKPDILLANWIIPQGFIATLTKLFFPRIRIILIAHGGDIGILERNIFLRFIGKIILRKVDKFIAICNLFKNKIIKITNLKDKEIPIIPLGINDNIFEKIISIRKKINHNTKTLLFVGRLEEKKGICFLLKAMKEVVEKHPDVVLKIVGDGTLRDEMINLSKRLNLFKNIVFIGAISHSQLPSYFDEALVFIAPSIDLKDDFEAIPRTILEAAAARVPIIATNAGGITDFIENGVTGIIVPQKSIKELSEKIIELIENETLREILAKKAYEKLKKEFTLSITGYRIQRIINEVMTNK
ncbi:MAG: glycosyltransferase [candidate division WOR-3 bacterium]